MVGIPDLLANVSDADGDPITLVGVSAASANGGAVVTNNGWVFYTPAPGFTNTDTFTYLVTDGWSAPVAGTVTVDITVDDGTLAESGYHQASATARSRLAAKAFRAGRISFSTRPTRCPRRIG